MTAPTPPYQTEDEINTAVANLISLRIPSLGPRRARLIVTAYHGRHEEALDAGPEGLARITTIDQKTRARITLGWQETRHARNTIAHIAKLGIPSGIAVEIRNLCGLADTNQVELTRRLQSNPYGIITAAGGDFRTADHVARQLAIPRDSPLRIGGGIGEYLLRAERQGHTHVDHVTVCTQVASLLRLPQSTVRERLWESHSTGIWTRSKTPSGWSHLQRTPIANAEIAINASLRKRIALGPNDEQRTIHELLDHIGGPITEAQRDAARLCMSHRISIITGGAGTGKTTATSLIVQAARRASIPIIGCAPTGLAASRLANVALIKATTIHRLLGLSRDGVPQRVPDPASFKPIIIVDEISMLGTPLMDTFLATVPERVAIIFLGDTNQLASIEPGAILQDMVNSRIIPTANLTYIHRQEPTAHDSRCGDSIIDAAYKILAGEEPIFGTTNNSQVVFIEKTPDKLTANQILDNAARVSKARSGIDHLRVISPSRKGPLGTVALSLALRERLNPPTSAQHDPAMFRVNDRIIYTENSKKLGLANGDLGRIIATELDEEAITCIFSRSRQVHIDSDHIENVSHAMALTGHQTQGSEFDDVIIPITSDHNYTLNRTWLYTAITRAKKRVRFIGSRQAFRDALDRPCPHRDTMLRHYLATP